MTREAPASPTCTILLADDEPFVRGVIRAISLEHGYRLLEAGDGQEAVRLSSQYDGEIHLLLTDVVISGMSGPELADALTTSRPYTRVLYMSARPPESVFTRQKLEQGIWFVQKPFSSHQLVQKIRNVLGAWSSPRSDA